MPTGFITEQNSIPKKIRQKLVDERMLRGVVSMPSNIFATTGTNVSILFIDKTNKEDVILIDASSLGEKVKEGKNQKTLLSATDEAQIIDTFNNQCAVDDFSTVVSYKDIQAKNYSLSAGQYFDVKIENVEITPEEFSDQMDSHSKSLSDLFDKSKDLESNIMTQLMRLKND